MTTYTNVLLTIRLEYKLLKERNQSWVLAHSFEKILCDER